MKPHFGMQLLIKAKYSLLISTFLLALLACSDSDKPEAPEAEAQKFNNPTEPYQYELHGVTINNDYNWLASGEHDKIEEWSLKQKLVSDTYFSGEEFDDLIETSSTGTTSSFDLLQKVGNNYFVINQTKKNEGLKWDLIIFNKFSYQLQRHHLPITSDKQVIDFSLSPGGRFAALQVKSEEGFHWLMFDTFQEKFREFTPLSTTHSTNLSWLSQTSFIYSGDNSAFFYNFENTEAMKIFDLTEQLDRKESSWESLNTIITDDNSYIIFNTKILSNKENKIWIQNLTTKNKDINKIASDIKAELRFIGAKNKQFYFLTNLAAPRYRIISINIDEPSRRYWKEIIPQQNAILLDAQLINNKWMLVYRENAKTKVHYTSLNGSNPKVLQLSTNSEIRIEKNNNPIGEAVGLLSVEHSAIPSMPYELVKDEITPVFSSDAIKENPNLNIDGLDVIQSIHFYRSKDGSRIPISLLSEKSTQKNKPLLLLTGGIFGENDSYKYQSIIHNFIKKGGLVAIAHIRGGGTYGRSWHQAAIGEKKYKAIEDIISAQNWLFDKNYTNPSKIAIISNRLNSILIAQALNHPESRFAAAVFDKGYFNLIQETGNRVSDHRWQNEFDFAQTKKSIRNLIEIDPFSNITLKQYPAILVLADNQIGSARQYLAKIQNHQVANNPILILENDPLEEIKIQFFLKQQLKL